MSEERFEYKVYYTDDKGNPSVECGVMPSPVPMPQIYTITVPPDGISYCLWTDECGIRVLPGSKITLRIEGEVRPWDGGHTMEISARSGNSLL